jgi:hypothetical protein
LFFQFNDNKNLIIRPFRRSLVLDKSVKTSWKEKMQLKAQRKAAKEYEGEIKAAKQQIIEV